MRLWKNCIFDLYGTLVDICTDELSSGLWEKMAGWYGEYGAVYEPETLKQRYFELIQELEDKVKDKHQREFHSAGPHPDIRLERDFRSAQTFPEIKTENGLQPNLFLPEIKIEEVFLRLFRESAGTDRDLNDYGGGASDRDLIKNTATIFRALSTKYIRPYEGASELLKALKAAGRRVFLLSNAQSIFTLKELESLDLKKYFDAIYLSSDFGVKKPDPHFFKLLLDREHLNPGDSVMIGNDAGCDILPAKNLGLSTVYLHSDISPDESLPKADYVVNPIDLYLVNEILS